MTHENWLRNATESLEKQQNLPRGEAHTRARLLLDGATGIRYAHLLNPTAILEDSTQETLQNWLERAQNGEPLPYILGRAPFFGRNWQVGPGVLIPRPETELLIETALARLDDAPRKIADLGTGSGIIAATLALERPRWRVWATEISPKAQKIAARNFQHFDLDSRVQLLQGKNEDWLPFAGPLNPKNLQDDLKIFQDDLKNLQDDRNICQDEPKNLQDDRRNLQDDRNICQDEPKISVFSVPGTLMEVQSEKEWSGFFDLLVSNPPYIAKSEIEGLQIEVRDFEPRLALDGGADGLDPYRQIAARGRDFLAADGFCIVEIGAAQGQSVPALFQNCGWHVQAVLKDFAGLDRVVVARNR